MYAMQRYGLPLGAVWVALFVPLTLVPLLDADDMAEVISLVLVYTAVDVFLGAYALATRGAVEARGRNQALAVDLREANSRLEDYSRRLERLAVARERNRLGRRVARLRHADDLQHDAHQPVRHAPPGARTRPGGGPTRTAGGTDPEGPDRDARSHIGVGARCSRSRAGW